MQQGKSDYVLVSLSFNSYSTNGLAAIAAKVSNEFNDEEHTFKNIDEVVDDFEFSLVFSDAKADEFSSNGQIRSMFPIFNSNFLQGDDEDRVIRKNDGVSSIGIPLKELFMDDREERSSTTSSSEIDELESIPARTYCLWMPKSPQKWKKSRSTGQGSKRWKLLDLLRRSNSEGKGPFLFPTTPKHIEEKLVRGNDSPNKERNSGDSVRKVLKTDGASLHEVFYLRRNRAEKEGRKRKSYLPYRQNIVGFFTSVNWKGKSSSL